MGFQAVDNLECEEESGAHQIKEPQQRVSSKHQSRDADSPVDKYEEDKEEEVAVEQNIVDGQNKHECPNNSEENLEAEMRPYN